MIDIASRIKQKTIINKVNKVIDEYYNCMEKNMIDISNIGGNFMKIEQQFHDDLFNIYHFLPNINENISNLNQNCTLDKGNFNDITVNNSNNNNSNDIGDIDYKNLDIINVDSPPRKKRKLNGNDNNL